MTWFTMTSSQGLIVNRCLGLVGLHPPGRDKAKAGTKGHNPSAARRRCQRGCSYPEHKLLNSFLNKYALVTAHHRNLQWHIFQVAISYSPCHLSNWLVTNTDKACQFLFLLTHLFLLVLLVFFLKNCVTFGGGKKKKVAKMGRLGGLPKGKLRKEHEEPVFRWRWRKR